MLFVNDLGSRCPVIFGAGDRTFFSAIEKGRFILKKYKDTKRCPYIFGAGDRTFFSTIERSTGPFSQIFSAAGCTENLEFVSSPVNQKNI